jgi:serine/threonine-protein kinase
MEWIEGQTLRQKLTQGPLPVPEVLGIASQILDALVAAHEGGIIHRDLKPENIMVNAGGRAKVLDFGSAKRTVRPNDPTLTRDTGNTLGAVAGTPGYMSPEQIRGEKLDFRSDHFSFGAVLYELTTGRRAFAGNSAADVQAAILLRQPESLRLRRHCNGLWNVVWRSPREIASNRRRNCGVSFPRLSRAPASMRQPPPSTTSQCSEPL